MEKAVTGMREDSNHQHRNSGSQQKEIKAEKTDIELEAQLKEQEFKEMLKRLQ